MCLLCICSTAQAKNRINDVLFESASDAMRFMLVTTDKVPLDRIEKLADADPSVLMVRLNDVGTARNWVKLKDPSVKRALIHPSREKNNASVLRIRFIDKRVTSAYIAAVQIIAEDSGIRIDLPRSKSETLKPIATPKALTTDALKKAMNTASTSQPSTMQSASVKPQETAKPEGSSKAQPLSSASPERPVEAPSPNVVSPINPLPIQPESTQKEGEQSKTDRTNQPSQNPVSQSSERISPLATPSKASPLNSSDAQNLVFMPGVRTRDIVAGFTDMTLRLEQGLKASPGVRRLAVFPFLELDDSAKRDGLGDVSQALLMHRLVKRPGIISADQDMLKSTLRELPRDDLGRYAIDEARAVGSVVGADTMLVGTVSATGNGFIVDARAIDVTTGTRLVEASQEFDGEQLNQYAEIVREDRTVLGGAWRSAVAPGWGQFYHQNFARGITYAAIFSTAFISGILAAATGNMYANRYTSSQELAGVKYRDQANRSYEQANMFLAIAGLMWSSSVADSLITGERHYHIDPERFEAAKEDGP